MLQIGKLMHVCYLWACRSDGHEFVELMWENGQAMVHGRRKHPQPAFPPFGFGGGSSRAQERNPGGGGDAFAKASDFGAMGMAAQVHDFASGFAATHNNGDDDTVPWIHYPIIDDDDSAAPAALASTDYCSDFFSELHAAAAAAATPPTDLASLPAPSNNKNGATNNTSAPVATTTYREPSKESHDGLSVPTTRSQGEMQPQLTAAKQPRLSGGHGLMNFSLFSRPAALARTSLQSAQRPQGTADKASNVTASNRVVSTVVQTTSGPRSALAEADQRAPGPPQPKEVQFASTTAAPMPTVGSVQHEKTRDKADRSMPMHKNGAPKVPEATIATSSVCSGNGAATDELWRQQKRKSHAQAECSASQDEDLDDEPGALRRSATRSTKRIRTAEVHNLSERRRRDRINEKMRALQELIPNCNKIDKASMLDEAIEYLKTLQLQVQMMSMGTGLCIPPMLLPAAMQHMQIPPMVHFPHLGMGLGYGMGVFDMNRSTTIPIPPMAGARFPCPMIPGASPQGLGIPATNTMPMFGVPGQAIPSSATSVPPFASLAGLPVRPNRVPQVSGAKANMVKEQQQSIANQQQQCLNKEAAQGANPGDPQMPIIMQGDNEQFRIPSSGQTKSSQFSDGTCKGTNTTARDGAET
ncbi:hypothetical protein GUJ93_ZPchr0008g12514 [Zizania palustris]|uniref:BHLH domain-containing protein n=1 Tax=Zizania palustris TaxID=103762 RepID=A0A8J5RGH3_ZIZPA|nr:hypothetical protein GUJ93_ZPchr0008g12514 [Zizania palustris]